MLPLENSAILLTFIKPPFVIKIFVLSNLEWPFYTEFTVSYFEGANNKGVDQTADAQAGLRLCCSHAKSSGFLMLRPILELL